LTERSGCDRLRCDWNERFAGCDKVWRQSAGIRFDFFKLAEPRKQFARIENRFAERLPPLRFGATGVFHASLFTEFMLQLQQKVVLGQARSNVRSCRLAPRFA